MLAEKPHVLVISGLDPSGGAGIQADIQAITALGAHPLPIISCLTVQDTINVHGAEPVSAELIRKQLQCLAADIPIHAVKTGALGDATVVRELSAFLRQRERLPLVVDPVIKAAGGGDLADETLLSAMFSELFPLADVLTPNGPELQQLGEHEQEADAARNLLKSGCNAVLATGGHGTGHHIENILYRADGSTENWQLKRVGGEYHGSGCTLAAGISAGLAAGQSLEEAIERAQNFVAASIQRAQKVGAGQPVPNREQPR